MSKVDRIAIAVLLLVAVAEIGAFLALPFDGYDSPSHLFWVSEWRRLWQIGVLYPRWMPDSYHGFGAPSFYLYPPLAYFFSSGLGLLAPAVGAMTLIKIGILAALALSGLAMYYYLRWRNPDAHTAFAIVASLVYAFAPYRFFNMTVRAAYSEHVAFIFVPLAFWGLDTIMRAGTDGRRRMNGMLLLAASIALMLFTNLPAAASVLIILLIYAATQKGPLRNLKALAISTVLAVLLSALYLLPVAHFYGDAQLARLWVPYPFVQCSPVLGIFTKLAVMINTYNLIGLFGAATLLVALWKTARAWRWLLLALIVLQLPPFAYYIFLYVFPFTVVQLPARLTMGLLIILSAAWFEHLTTKDRRSKRPVISLVVAGWALCMVPLIVVQLSGVHLRAWIARPADDPPEYATRWSPPYDSAAKARTALDTGWIAKGATIARATQAPYADTIECDAPAGARLTVHRAYWPLWQARIDGRVVQTNPDSIGRLRLAVPAGPHTVITELTESTSEIAGRWISLATLFSLLTAGILNWRKGRQSNG